MTAGHLTRKTLSKVHYNKQSLQAWGDILLTIREVPLSTMTKTIGFSEIIIGLKIKTA